MARPRSIDLDELEQLRAGGATVADLAVRFGVTERSVKRAIAGLRLAAAGEMPPADAHHHQAAEASSEVEDVDAQALRVGRSGRARVVAGVTLEEAREIAAAWAAEEDRPARAVRILLDGLMVGGKVYRAGELVEDPHPRLVELAGGELLLGRRVAGFVEAEGAE